MKKNLAYEIDYANKKNLAYEFDYTTRNLEKNWQRAMVPVFFCAYDLITQNKKKLIYAISYANFKKKQIFSLLLLKIKKNIFIFFFIIFIKIFIQFTKPNIVINFFFKSFKCCITNIVVFF